MNPYLRRQGQIDYEQLYFYTETISGFKMLLKDDRFKQVIISSLKYLVDKELVTIYSFVIMPNHIHLIWTIHKSNGKESPSGSFAKYTAHQFKKMLSGNEEMLKSFQVNASDRKYNFWKRDPLAIPLTSEKALLQKMDYIDNNPVVEKWELSKLPEEYKWSSARLYYDGVDVFDLVTHFRS